MALYAKWKLFGHILRLPLTVPANKAMIAYFSQPGTGRRGRPRTTLPIVLNDDLKGYSIRAEVKEGFRVTAYKSTGTAGMLCPNLGQNGAYVWF